MAGLYLGVVRAGGAAVPDLSGTDRNNPGLKCGPRMPVRAEYAGHELERLREVTGTGTTVKRGVAGGDGWPRPPRSPGPVEPRGRYPHHDDRGQRPRRAPAAGGDVRIRRRTARTPVP